MSRTDPIELGVPHAWFQPDPSNHRPAVVNPDGRISG